MAKDIKFNIKLTIDGKEQVVTASTNVSNLAKELGIAKTQADRTRESILRWNQTSQAMRDVYSGVMGLTNVMQTFIDANKASAESSTKLVTIMRERMNATDGEVESVKQLASEQTKLGVIGSTVQLAGVQQVATFLKEKTSIDTLLPAMNNLIAQKFGLNATTEDAVGIGNLFGKAMQGQITALKRVGITFTDAQAQVLKFGTESERASMLAQVVTDNVGNMNIELGKTDAGKAKQLSNAFAGISKQIGAVLAPYESLIVGLGQLGFAATAITSVTTGVISLAKSLGVAKGVTIAVTAATNFHKNAMISLTAATGSATIAATALSAAYTLGLSIAITGIVALISDLCSSTDDATKGTHDMSEAAQQAKSRQDELNNTMVDAKSGLDIMITKLKDFKGSKKEEKKLVKECNDKYGDAMGQYGSVSDWYKVLVNNSKDYCEQLVNEVKMRQLANQAATADQKVRDIKYNKDGSLKKYGTKRLTLKTWKKDKDGNLHPTEVVVGNSQLENANKAANAAYREGLSSRRQMNKIVHKQAGLGAKIHKQVQGTQQIAEKEKPGKPGPGKDTDKTYEKGSLDWYENSLSRLKDKIGKTGNASLAKSLQTDYNALENKYKDLKIKIGIEQPDKVEVKTYTEELQDKLAAAQHDFSAATTVDARVVAITKVNDIQKEIDEATVGQVTIQASTEASYIVKGSVEDKRQSHANAEQKAGKIQQDYEIGIIGKEKAIQDIDDINKQLASLGVKPIEVAVKTSDIDKAKEKTQGAMNAVDAMGGSLASLGSALEAPELNIAGTLAQAVASMVLGYAEATTQAASLGPWAWIAFAATGLAQLAAIVTSVKGMSTYATGGIVGGNSNTGDKLMVRVNSGEMILNKAQQARMLKILNGGITNSVASLYAPRRTVPAVDVNKLSGMIQQPQQFSGLKMEVRGRKLVGVLANETRISSKSGRRTNINI